MLTPGKRGYHFECLPKRINLEALGDGVVQVTGHGTEYALA